MKKIILVSLISAILICNYAGANNGYSNNTDNQKSHYKSLPQNWSVSQYGFLIFPVAADMEEYLTYIKSMTHSGAQEYLSSISFTSLGSTLYGQSYADQAITDAQAINYTLNPSRVLQIHGIVIRPVGESTTCEDVKWQFVLAMSASNLSSGSYNNISRGTYDGNVMNKYATNPPASDTLSLVQKMSQSNAGNAATDPNPCPTNLAERRPFWGWGSSSCTLAGTYLNPETNTYHNYYYYCAASYYIFWINVNQGNCGNVYSCPD